MATRSVGALKQLISHFTLNLAFLTYDTLTGAGGVKNILSLFNPFLFVYIVHQNKDLFLQMLSRSIASRYRGSVLGFFWSFVHPLVMLSVYSFVFGVVFKARWGIDILENSRASFALIMFCGMAVFNIFSESIATSTSIVIANPGYVKKVVFPLELLPLCNVVTSFVFGLAWFVLLLFGSLFILKNIPWTIIFLPVTLVPLLLFSGGISFLLASLGVYLRDMQQIVGVVTQILFFMTPIFYPISIVPEKLRWILQLNPLSTIVEQTRRLFLYGQTPDPLLCFAVLFFSFVVFQLGLAWFVKTKKGFADVM